MLKPNHAVVFWPSYAAALLAKSLRFEVTTALSCLIEASAIDLSAYKSANSEFSIFGLQNKFLVFYLIYFYHLKYKITFCFNYGSNLQSMDTTFLNAGWLERELAEMYGLFYYNKLDNRTLLLDYTMMDAPLVKSFNCAGSTEVFYNPIDEAVIYYDNSFVEL